MTSFYKKVIRQALVSLVESCTTAGHDFQSPSPTKLDCLELKVETQHHCHVGFLQGNKTPPPKRYSYISIFLGLLDLLSRIGYSRWIKDIKNEKLKIWRILYKTVLNFDHQIKVILAMCGNSHNPNIHHVCRWAKRPAQDRRPFALVPHKILYIIFDAL